MDHSYRYVFRWQTVYLSDRQNNELSIEAIHAWFLSKCKECISSTVFLQGDPFIRDPAMLLQVLYQIAVRNYKKSPLQSYLACIDHTS